ncbi:MAG: LPS export ABC transporter periplasmic protein LptC [Nitrospirae bacterium RBG_13_39_12]|nr:MAG: LPS export ABC transporter periplasmic protein LptC [Nitrospirae bacterium RBG_13_39_12]
MKNILKIGLFILFLSILFIILRNDREINVNLQFKGNSFIENLKILQKKNGITTWTLNARKADFIEGEDKAELSDISMVIQKNDVVLHVDKGVYNLSNQSFSTDSVVNAEAKDFTIISDSIDYDISSGKIKTEGRVEFENKKFKIEGKGMKADASQKVDILDDVKATFYK